MAHQAGAYPDFCGMKRLGIFLLLLDWMLVHRRVTPSIKFAGTHFYTWVERGTVRVKCLAQEHNTMSKSRARTRTAGSGDEPNNHEDTAITYKNKIKRGCSYIWNFSFRFSEPEISLRSLRYEEKFYLYMHPCIIVYLFLVWAGLRTLYTMR